MSTAGPQHVRFTEWTKKQKIIINGVGPAKVPGRGLGITAQRKIEAGEELVKVPVSALLTITSIPRSFRLAHEGITVHGLLASFLAFGALELSPFTPWRETWPTLQELEDTMPILWLSNRKPSNCLRSPAMVFPRQVCALPPAIGGRWGSERMSWHSDSSSGLLCQQERKLQQDWAIASRAFPDETLEKYRYHWLLVNTRSFYYEPQGANYQQAREDRMALCPFVDYFNHQDHGCDVAFDGEGYTVKSDRVYETGEEIFVSYGNHSNDFLLVECAKRTYPNVVYIFTNSILQDGFVLEENKWDYLPIDDLVLHKWIYEPARKRLESAGYLGDYTLGREGVCHRTQVAIRTETLGIPEWTKFIEGQDVVNMCDERKADSYIVSRILDVYFSEAANALNYLETTTELQAGPQKMLVKRWSQIKSLITDAFRHTANSHTGLELASCSEMLDEKTNEFCA
ncbi:hypothetical protein MMC07_008570 [Pseudocyphellaria aurata]|nr:hypothetical protein [Pseudocyphellaria aurata]